MNTLLFPSSKIQCHLFLMKASFLSSPECFFPVVDWFVVLVVLNFHILSAFSVRLSSVSLSIVIKHLCYFYFSVSKIYSFLFIVGASFFRISYQSFNQWEEEIIDNAVSTLLITLIFFQGVIRFTQKRAYLWSNMNYKLWYNCHWGPRVAMK